MRIIFVSEEKQSSAIETDGHWYWIPRRTCTISISFIQLFFLFSLLNSSLLGQELSIKWKIFERMYWMARLLRWVWYFLIMPNVREYCRCSCFLCFYAHFLLHCGRSIHQCCVSIINTKYGCSVNDLNRRDRANMNSKIPMWIMSMRCACLQTQANYEAKKIGKKTKAKPKQRI